MQKIKNNNVGADASVRPNSRGITLIALVITIIVMLILVAVTVTVAINGNLFGTARTGVDREQMAIEKERFQAAVVSAYDDINGIMDYDFLNENLPERFTYTEEDGVYVYTGPYGTQFTVAEDGTITVLNTENPGETPGEEDPEVTPPEEEPQATIASVVEVGDFIRYDAGNKTFSMTEEQTGVSGDAQTYNTGTYTWNPETASTSKYGLWRVFSVDNETGKVEIISYQDVTNGVGLKLYGRTGFLKVADTLNTFCSNYVNNAYAENGRSVGGSSVGIADETVIPATHSYSKKVVNLENDVYNDIERMNNIWVYPINCWYPIRAAYYDGFINKQPETAVIAGVHVLFITDYSSGTKIASVLGYYGNNSYLNGKNSYLIRGDGARENEAITMNYEELAGPFGIIAVITLKSEVTVASGSGLDTDPYVLAPAN